MANRQANPLHIESPISEDIIIRSIESPLPPALSSQAPNIASSPTFRRPQFQQNRPQQIIYNTGNNQNNRQNEERKGPDSNINSLDGVIWGTDVHLEDVSKRFQDFFLNFKKDDQIIYPSIVQDCIDSETWHLNLDCHNLHEYDSDLYRRFISYPQELLPSFDQVVNEYAKEHFSDMLEEVTTKCDIWVRPFNLLDIRSMRNMNPNDIDKLVSIRGMVIRSTAVIPDLQMAFFRCIVCHQEVKVNVELGRISEPTRCSNPNCQSNNTMELIHNRCQFQDKQLIKIQETPEHIPDGETPQTIDVYCYDTMVDICRPGDRVEVTGVYRVSAIRIHPRRREVEAVYKTYIDGVHIKKARSTQFSVENSSIEDKSNEYYTSFKENDEYQLLHEQKINIIKNLAFQSKNIYERLVKSLAPSIWEMEDCKKGILCQLFGACNKDFSNFGGNRFRNQLNILLCGDPGTSKSQLLQYVHKISPRGIYTSGKGSSAVGLTAYITKDHENGDLILESGALVLSDRGICCIDEFDKMSENARSILHEVMEQQTVSIAKAGIICSLNARTSILAAANPKESRYNPMKSVIENIDLPPTLMSRFDLIYLILDRPNEHLDRKLAKHIVSLYYKKEDDNNENDEQNDHINNEDSIISQELLMQYISYSRCEIHPQLTDEACDKLINGYCEMRNIGRISGKKVITATPRQLESLIRISESLARMKHSQYVTVEDVDEAIRLHKVATLAAATNPKTGAIDLDSIAVGRSMEEGKILQEQAQWLLESIKNVRSKTIRCSQLLKKYNLYLQNTNKLVNNKNQININELKNIVEKLESNDRLRVSDWLNEDPIITILDVSDL